ncbi:hypothetical protein [Bacillus altitudinis]|uniref:hypothetical protein n=1 Tax=Bacillus altitudinis TaxID=293387 RepID=UPI00203D23C9|nr:hypothetical protein [Bacillus altitudinis]MCM3045235.1 hypothetical protein [Bacillus altitudinis]MEC1801795.1 hypothetical protein [Bacillus altitudinis]
MAKLLSKRLYFYYTTIKKIFDIFLGKLILVIKQKLHFLRILKASFCFFEDCDQLEHDSFYLFNNWKK